MLGGSLYKQNGVFQGKHILSISKVIITLTFNTFQVQGDSLIDLSSKNSTPKINTKNIDREYIHDETLMSLSHGNQMWQNVRNVTHQRNEF